MCDISRVHEATNFHVCVSVTCFFKDCCWFLYRDRSFRFLWRQFGMTKRDSTIAKHQGKPSCFHGICICLIRLIFCPCKVTLMLLILRLVPDTFICIYVFLDINVIQRGHRQLNYSRSICNLCAGQFQNRPCPPPPRANPGAFDFFEKFWSNSPLCCQDTRSNAPPVRASKRVKSSTLQACYL